MDEQEATFQKEAEEYKREAEMWKDAFQDLQMNNWHIPKPHLSSPVRSMKNAVSHFMKQDIETIYKTYMVIAIVCAVASAMADIYSNTRSMYR